MDSVESQTLILFFIIIVVPVVLLALILSSIPKIVDEVDEKITKALDKKAERAIQNNFKKTVSDRVISFSLTTVCYIVLAIVVLIGALVFIVLPPGGATIIGVGLVLLGYLEKYRKAHSKQMPGSAFDAADRFFNAKEELAKGLGGFHENN
jgi:hypothetical protein